MRYLTNKQMVNSNSSCQRFKQIIYMIHLDFGYKMSMTLSYGYNTFYFNICNYQPFFFFGWLKMKIQWVILEFK